MLQITDTVQNNVRVAITHDSVLKCKKCEFLSEFVSFDLKIAKLQERSIFVLSRAKDR